MELGQKLSICRGQQGRHLSLGLPHSFYFSLCVCRFPSLLFFFSSTLFPLPLPFFSFYFFSFWLTPLPVIEQSLCASIFSPHLSLYNLCSLSCVPLDILCLSLCATPPPELSSMDLPRLFSRILLHHPCFNISLILLPSPPLLLCLELLVVLRTLAPSPSAAICFGLSALQPAG